MNPYVVKLLIQYRKPIMQVVLGFFVFIIVSFLLIFNRESIEDGGIATDTQNLSAEVLRYKPLVEKYAKQYGGSEYVPYILALMQVESGGRGGDPMQASESLEILLARVSQPEILRYLAENRGKQSISPTSAKRVEEVTEYQEEELYQSFQDSQETDHANDRLESKRAFEEERQELAEQNKQKISKKSTNTRTKEIPNSKALTAEWKNKYVLILAGFVVLLFLLNGFLFWRQSTLANKLEVWQTKAEKAVTLVEKQPKIDTTSRFFLASYFSQAKEAPYKEGLKKFVGTSVEKWERPSGELNSMFLYEINEEKKGTEVNYILTISEEKTTKIKKISFHMKEKEGTILVVSQPKIEDFSW
ncbi:lysozyme family protein [Enterococcus hirae]|nr:lysozyme family protein [Enterococcus hirae]